MCCQFQGGTGLTAAENAAQTAFESTMHRDQPQATEQGLIGRQQEPLCQARRTDGVQPDVREFELPDPGGAVADIAALKRFILEQINPVEGIDTIRSCFALKQVRDTTALALARA